MHGKRTPAWWLSRLYLAIGVVVVLLIANLASHSIDPCFGCSDNVSVGPLVMPSGVLLAVVGLAGGLAGLIWMVRIARGPRDEPPPWRHRDH